MDSNPTLPVKLAKCSDIPLNEGIVVTTENGHEIALFNRDGAFFALENTCPHQGGPLGEGTIEDGCVTCPWHGWQFDVQTGACQNMPGEDARSVPIVVLNGEIFLKD